MLVVRARHGSLRGRNSRLPQDRRSGLARASAARRARRAAHRMCAVQSALIRGLGTSFSLNMTRTSKQELKMHAQAKPERPKGEGHGWPEFYSPQMRPQGHGKSEFSLSRIPTAQTPWPRPYSSTWAIITVAGISWVISARLDYASRGHAFHAGWVSPAHPLRSVPASGRV